MEFDTHSKMVISQGGTFEKMKEKVIQSFVLIFFWHARVRLTDLFCTHVHLSSCRVLASGDLFFLLFQLSFFKLAFLSL